LKDQRKRSTLETTRPDFSAQQKEELTFKVTYEEVNKHSPLMKSDRISEFAPQAK